MQVLINLVDVDSKKADLTTETRSSKSCVSGKLQSIIFGQRFDQTLEASFPAELQSLTFGEAGQLRTKRSLFNGTEHKDCVLQTVASILVGLQSKHRVRSFA